MHAVVHVYTYRDGLLAKLAHDLRLTVGAFEIVVDRGDVRAWFDPGSLTVDGVAHGEQVDSAAPSPEDKRKIEASLRREVLQVEQFPRIELTGRLLLDTTRGVVDARLRLHGQEQALRIPFLAADGGLTADVTFAPSQFGIKPYKAIGGAIRTADRLRVRALAAQADFAALGANSCAFGPDH
jgi:hypothetical protein